MLCPPLAERARPLQLLWVEMSLKVYNTLKRQKETFVPLDKGPVRMYVCGVTVYDDCHLGHARAYVSFDIVRRYLEYKNYTVKHVQNFTDIDDKVIKKARAYRKELQNSKGEEITLKSAVKFIAEKYTQEYFKYMDKLGVKRADLYPRATEHIPDMIALIKCLLEKEYAYEVDGDIFFSVGKFHLYGKLSGRKLDEMKAGARVEVDERKSHPLDFALWKKVKPDEPFWESPWGKGRPGWHIECSAMSMKYLGESFDMHGGGQDLMFPHHENEIAQSSACTGKPFSRYWLHNGFVTINKVKMSKSLGNFFTLKEIFEKYEPHVVRLFLISTHYRHPIDFSDDGLDKTRSKYERLTECGRKLGSLKTKKGKLKESEVKGEGRRFRREFEVHMDNDFNTPGALGVIFDMVRYLNSGLNNGHTETDDFAAAADEFMKLCEVLGLTLTDEMPHFEVKQEKIDESRSLPDGKIEELLNPARELSKVEVEELTIQKELARKKKDWEKADKIRAKLSEYVRIEDFPQGTIVSGISLGQ